MNYRNDDVKQPMQEEVLFTGVATDAKDICGNMRELQTLLLECEDFAEEIRAFISAPPKDDEKQRAQPWCLEQDIQNDIYIARCIKAELYEILHAISAEVAEGKAKERR